MAVFEVNAVVATVVGRLSTMIAPPLPLFAAPAASLLMNVEVEIVADPVPMPPGIAKARITRSAPPPPAAPDRARLWLKVVPETVNMPVDAVCIGADGVNTMPPPLCCSRLEFATVSRSVERPGALLPPIRQFVMFTSPPNI